MTRASGKGLFVLMCLLLLVPFVVAEPNAGSQEQPGYKLNKKEFKWLLKNARTASDHRQLARYYREKAERLMKDSEEHQELADAYTNRTIFEPKTGFPGGLLRHCRDLATDLRKAAKDAQSLADMHMALAQHAPD